MTSFPDTLSSSPFGTVQIDRIQADLVLNNRLKSVFGSPSDPMPLLEQRAHEILSDLEFILWEGDAQTFQFTFVSQSAEAILGYPCERWLTEASFWCDTVVHPADRNDAIGYCALATGQGRDHDFVYRALTAEGRTIWLHDVVCVIKGEKGLAERLRGIMVVIEAGGA